MKVLEIDFTLNGRPRRAETPSHWTVLDLLRDGLALTGTKDGCGEGVCGACTVLLEARPILSRQSRSLLHALPRASSRASQRMISWWPASAWTLKTPWGGPGR